VRRTTAAGLSKRGALARFGCNGERGARDYNGGLGAEPPARVHSRGRASGRESGGVKKFTFLLDSCV